MKTKTYIRNYNKKTSGKRLVESVYLTKGGKVAKRPTSRIMEVYAERRDIKYVQIFGKGRKNMYDITTRIVDTPANQMTKEQQEMKITEMAITMNRTGKLVLSAVLA